MSNVSPIDPYEPVDEDDTLDASNVDFTEDPDDNITAELRALFPDGDPSSADDWKELFNG